MKHFFLVLGTAALVIGCGSAVKLDTATVEDKSGVAVLPPSTSGESNAVVKSDLSSINMGKTAEQDAAPAIAKMVYFEYDSTVIRPEFQTIIEAHARFIKQNKSRKVALEGHTDERGGREYNLALGQKRAEAVKNAFNLLGVPDAQIEAVSFGKEKPAAFGSDEGSMSKNRRAEVNYR